jgi:hypothetical protein
MVGLRGRNVKLSRRTGCFAAILAFDREGRNIPPILPGMANRF